MKKTIKKHYHWILAGVVLLQLFVYGGAGNNFSPYHVIPVTQALGISRTAFSLVGSICSAISILSTLTSGWLLQRFGYRKTATVGLALAGIAYFLLASARNYWMLLLARALVGITAGVCSTAGISRVISMWFHRYRGAVLGLVTAATGIGSSILGLAQTQVIAHASWRGSFALVGCLLLLIALLVYLLVYSTPQELGLRPYGEGQTDTRKQAARNAAQHPGFPMQILRKRPSFYLMILCVLLSSGCIYMTQFIFVPYFQDIGMSAAQAGNLYSLMMMLLGGAKLLAGSLTDLIGAKKVVPGCLMLCSGSLVLLMLAGTGPLAVVAVVIYAFAMPLTTVMIPLLATELFGYYAQGQYIGVFVAMASAASMVASLSANWIYDLLGTYRPAFWGAAAAALLTLGLELILYRLVHRDSVLLSTERSNYKNEKAV